MFPEYLAMGMTYRQFWLEDCRLVIAYREAYKLKQEEANRSAWLNGLYLAKALGSVPIFVQGFIPKGTQIEPYPGKPIDFAKYAPKTPQQAADDAAQKKAEQIKARMLEYMKAKELQQAERAKTEKTQEGEE